MHFIDGQYVGEGLPTDFGYSLTELPIPLINNPPPTSIVGQFSEGESQKMPIFINSTENTSATPGGGMPMYIDWVRVYTK
ncbi:hypothetical protein, partial [Staphylococcus aureus]